MSSRQKVVNRKPKKALNESKKFQKLNVREQKVARDMPSDCVRNFLKARLDPFGTFTSVPCNPLNDTTPSYRFRTFQSVNITAANLNSGEGWVAVNWYRTALNDARGIYLSGPTATAVDVIAGASFFSANNTSAPISEGSITATGNGFKLVGVGLRYRDTTAPLYRQGYTLSWTTPANKALASRSYASIQASQATAIHNHTSEPLVVLYNSARDGIDDRFITVEKYLDAVGQPIGIDTFNAGILIKGVDAAHFSALVEVVGIYEYSIVDGPLASAAQQSPVDPNARNVITIAQKLQAEKRPTQSHARSYLDYIQKSGMLTLGSSVIADWMEGRSLTQSAARHGLRAIKGEM